MFTSYYYLIAPGPNPSNFLIIFHLYSVLNFSFPSYFWFLKFLLIVKPRIKYSKISGSSWLFNTFSSNNF